MSNSAAAAESSAGDAPSDSNNSSSGFPLAVSMPSLPPQIKSVFGVFGDAMTTVSTTVKDSVQGGKAITGEVLNSTKTVFNAAAEKTRKTANSVKEDLRAKVRGNVVFGVSLDSLMKRDLNLLTVPRVVDRCSKFIEEKGMDSLLLFQLAANPQHVDVLRRQFDADDIGAELNENTDAHVVAQLLRLFFIELPEPLIPYEFYDRVLATEESDNPMEEAAKVLHELPKNHLDVFLYMLAFLSRISSEAGRHGANSRITAVAFGPAWLRPRVVSSLVYDLPVIIKCTDRLIQRQQQLAEMIQDIQKRNTEALVNPTESTAPATESN